MAWDFVAPRRSGARAARERSLVARFKWLLVLSAVVVAAMGAATCSASNEPPGSPAGSGGGVGAGAGAGTGADSSGTAGAGGSSIVGAGSGGSEPGTCDPSCKAAGGTCSGSVCVLVENAGNLDGSTKGQLEGGGSADPGFQFSYPYDKTVFPRGLVPPQLQFTGGGLDALYVHITAPALDYKGYFGASAPARARMSQAMWLAVTLAARANDQVKVEVTKKSGSVVTGPIAQTWTIAQGSLRGTIYYETYDSQLAGGAGSVGIMKIAPGATQPTVLRQGCGNVCHAASADGSTLVSATNLGASASFDLQNNAAPIKKVNNDAFTFAGIYPDGSFVVSATHYRTWSSTPSRLFDTQTGAMIPNESWDGVVQHGGTPAFSPDGKWIAFNDMDVGNGHLLSVMAYDHATKVFSQPSEIAFDGDNTLAWPAFTPDSKVIVFHAGTSTSFETNNHAFGDLYSSDIVTAGKLRLDALNGYDASGTYLPAGDPRRNFAPTVLPVAVGGYFWVVFTSHRSYGNTLPSLDNNGTNGKLWVAAYDMNAAPGKDPSHPAFLLEGQELEANNLRGFWVLEPCKGDGIDCESGEQCCGGFCREQDGGPPQCSSTTQECSHEFEKCEESSDCCERDHLCINGFCAGVVPG
jgi:hypothetical protein